MRYLSLFSGIEACSVAWAPLGWECVAVAEIEPWPSRVLAHHYPDVPNLGDVTKVTEEQIAMLGRIDVVVFGSPCQDLSVAGKRKGLDGARSGLFFTAMQIVGWARQWCDCRFALWENVPGAFSSNKGRDFAAVVDAMAGLEGTGVPPKGWGTEGCALGSEAMVEWSTLDAQWFGVAQRRRRVFAIADFGDWRNRPPILLESESVRGDTAPRREAGQTAPTIPARSTAGGGLGTDFDCDGGLIPALSQCITTGTGQRYDPETETILPVTHSLRGEGFDASEDGPGRGTPLVPVFLHANKGRPAGRQSAHTEMVSVKPIVETLTTDGHAQSAVAVPVAFDTTQVTSAANRSNPQPGDPCHPLAAGAHAPAIAFPANLSGTQCASTAELAPSMGAANPTAVAFNFHKSGNEASSLGVSVERVDCLRAFEKSPMAAQPAAGMLVRRLLPEECEKLQGFPRSYTAIPWRGKPADQCPDGPRYKALGNSMAVPVMRWIGRSIDYAMIWSTP